MTNFAPYAKSPWYGSVAKQSFSLLCALPTSFNDSGLAFAYTALRRLIQLILIPYVMYLGMFVYKTSTRAVAFHSVNIVHWYSFSTGLRLLQLHIYRRRRRRKTRKTTPTMSCHLLLICWHRQLLRTEVLEISCRLSWNSSRQKRRMIIRLS